MILFGLFLSECGKNYWNRKNFEDKIIKMEEVKEAIKMENHQRR
jgi:hypothetical protein